MLALILQLEATPMHIGSRLVMMDVGGDDHAAAAPLRRGSASGEIFSRLATYSISSVTTPWRA